MSWAAIISMIISIVVIIGGFILFLGIAIRKDAKKDSEDL